MLKTQASSMKLRIVTSHVSFLALGSFIDSAIVDETPVIISGAKSDQYVSVIAFEYPELSVTTAKIRANVAKL